MTSLLEKTISPSPLCVALEGLGDITFKNSTHPGVFPLGGVKIFSDDETSCDGC